MSCYVIFITTLVAEENSKWSSTERGWRQARARKFKIKYLKQLACEAGSTPLPIIIEKTQS